MKVFDRVPGLYSAELDALKVLQGLPGIVRMIGYSSYQGNNSYIVKEFIDGENLENPVMVTAFPVKEGAAVISPLAPQEQRKVALWMITSLEALNLIHEKGFLIGDFKFEDFPWDRKRQQVTLFDFANAINTKRASYDSYRLPHERFREIRDILLQFFWAVNVGLGTVGCFRLTPIEGARIAGGKTLKEVASSMVQRAEELEVADSLKKLIGIFAEDASGRPIHTAGEYANALRAYFNEVAIEV